MSVNLSLGMGNLGLAVVFPSEDGKAVRGRRKEKGTDTNW